MKSLNGMDKIIIGRAINGIGLNGLEYLMDGDQYKQFDNKKEAKDFLIEEGMPEDGLENFWYRKYDPETDTIIKE